MDTRLLRAFVEVAERGSFSAAADHLGYTQSAVSQQIAVLEAELGASLLSRRPVAVTEAGARLLEHARPLLLRLDAARAEVARAAGPPPAVLVVGAAPLAAPLAAVALARLRATRPRMEATLRVGGRVEVAAAVAAGEAGLALVDGLAAPGDPIRLPEAGLLGAMEVVETDLAVALPSSHPLADRPSLRLPDLADARWLDAPEVAMPLEDLRAAAGSDGFRASLRYEGSDVRAFLALIASGQGLAVLPATALDGASGVAATPLSAPPLVHRIEVVHGALTPDAAELAALLMG